MITAVRRCVSLLLGYSSSVCNWVTACDLVDYRMMICIYHYRFRFAVAFLAFLIAVFVWSVRFDAVLVVTTNIALLWDMTPRSLVEVCGYNQMLAHFFPTAWPHVPECSNSLTYAYNVVCLTSYRYCRQVSIVSIIIDSVHLSAEQLMQ